MISVGQYQIGWYEAYWTGLGLTVGWLWWKLPQLIQRIRDWRQSKIQAEIARIEGAYLPGAYTPLQEPPPSLRERILEYWRQWKEDTRPRNPEEVAWAAYQQELGALWP